MDQVNSIFRLLGTPSETSWPHFPNMPAVKMQLFPIVDCHTISLGTDGVLIKSPKNMLRKKFPAEGYTPSAAELTQYRTTALSDSGFDLLNSTLMCNPEQRVTASAALEHFWFREEPLPVALSRAEIRQMRRNRDDAINSGAHHQALAQQRAQVASKVAAEHAAAIAATIKERMGL